MRFPSFLLVLLAACGAVGCQPGGSTPSADVARQSSEYIASWADMGMYLPDAKQVGFFREHFDELRPELVAALSAPESAVQQRAAYVIDEIGGSARACGPDLLRRLQENPERLIRMYLINALASVGYDDPNAIGELQRRYKTLSRENVPRGMFASEYDDVDERINVAAALYRLVPVEDRDEYREFVTQWLEPPGDGLSSRELNGYTERRWHAVIVLEYMPGAYEAIEPLDKMRQEEDAPAWVEVHVPRVLKALMSKPE
ncbi:hypothetical protein [Lacipirellula parvula]|nr:hypothetical protein [Lacipirellula parvula]